MKSLIVSILLISPAIASGAAPATNATDEEAIRRLHDVWLKAFDIGDAATLDRIEHDDFTVAGEFGLRTKAQHLEGARRRQQSGQTEEAIRRFDNRQFRFYGDVALITQTDHYPAKPPESAYDFQTTEVWVRSGGSWRVAHIHFTRVATKP